MSGTLLVELNIFHEAMTNSTSSKFEGMYEAIASISMEDVWQLLVPPLCSPNWDIYEIYREVIRHAIDVLYFKLPRQTYDRLSRVFGMNVFETNSFLDTMSIIHENMMLPIGLDARDTLKLITEHDVPYICRAIDRDTDAIRRTFCFAIRNGYVHIVRSLILAFELTNASIYTNIMLNDLFPIRLCFASPNRELWEIGMELFDSVLRIVLTTPNVDLINLCLSSGNVWMLEHVLTTIPTSYDEFTRYVSWHEHEYNRLDCGLLTILVEPKLLKGVWIIHDGIHKMSLTDGGYSIMRSNQDFGTFYDFDEKGYPHPNPDTAERLRSREIAFNALCRMVNG